MVGSTLGQERGHDLVVTGAYRVRDLLVLMDGGRLLHTSRNVYGELLQAHE